MYPKVNHHLVCLSTRITFSAQVLTWGAGSAMSGHNPEPEREPQSPPTGRAKAKAAAKPSGRGRVSRAQVAAAARELPGSAADRAEPVPQRGILPPEPSSTGRSYYVVREQQPGTSYLVCCGQSVVLHEIGGRWIGHHRGPITGFESLESAINFCHNSLGLTEVRVRWA